MFFIAKIFNFKNITIKFIVFITLLEKFSKDEDVDFIMIISKKVEDLPEVAKQYLI